MAGKQSEKEESKLEKLKQWFGVKGSGAVKVTGSPGSRRTVTKEYILDPHITQVSCYWVLGAIEWTRSICWSDGVKGPKAGFSFIRLSSLCMCLGPVFQSPIKSPIISNHLRV